MIDRAKFFAEIRDDFGGKMTASQVSGCEDDLVAWEKWYPGADLRWIAYSMATDFHETARTMQPIAEYGKGRGRTYGRPTGKWKQVYYGRGRVQLTWQRNYEFATTRLRAMGVIQDDQDLAKTPDLAMRTDIAAAILCVGMVEGWFTGRKLEQYFKGKKSDPVGARRIINGTDKAAKIAGYHYAFLHALQAAS